MATNSRTKTKAAGAATQGLEVVARSPKGMWRGGRFWAAEAQTVSLAELTEEQAEQIRNEPALIVREVEIPAQA